MRHKTIEHVPPQPATTREVETGIECDICHCAGAVPREARAPFGRTADGDNVRCVTVEIANGVAYPEGGTITTTSYDVCPDCWWGVLVPIFNNPPSVREHEF
jgi:hypothetical protein